MSIKLHFLLSHLDYFPKHYGDLSEEQSECFHQDIRIIEESYQGRWDVNFLADVCWCLKWDDVAAEHRRKSLKWSFLWIFQFTIAQCEPSISAQNLVLFV